SLSKATREAEPVITRALRGPGQGLVEGADVDHDGAADELAALRVRPGGDHRLRLAGGLGQAGALFGVGEAEAAGEHPGPLQLRVEGHELLDARALLALAAAVIGQ